MLNYLRKFGKKQESYDARWVKQRMARTAHQRVILEMNSSENPVHRVKEGPAQRPLWQRLLSSQRLPSGFCRRLSQRRALIIGETS